MQIRDVAYWLGIHPPAASKALCKARGVTSGTVDITEEMSLMEAKQLWDAAPGHRRVLLITIQPDKNGNDVANSTMLGDWDGRQMRAADRLFKRSYKNFKQAFIHSKQAHMKGHSAKEFRTWPTKEEIEAVEAEDQLRIAQQEVERNLELAEPEEQDELVAAAIKAAQQLDDPSPEEIEELLEILPIKEPLETKTQATPSKKRVAKKKAPKKRHITEKKAPKKRQTVLEAQPLKAEAAPLHITEGVHVISEAELEERMKA